MVGKTRVQDEYVPGIKTRREKNVVETEAEMPAVVGDTETIAVREPGVGQVISLDAAKTV